MNQKKSKTKSKKRPLKEFTKKSNLKKFFIIFLFAFIASIISFFIINSKENKESKNNNILENKEIKKETTNTTLDELKLFDEKKPQQNFDEISKIEDKHGKFEEYTAEFDKDIIEKEQEEQLNEKIHQKIEQIKEEKKTDKKIEEKKKEVINKEIPKQTSDKDIITTKDTYKFDKSNKPKIVILIDDVSTQKQKDTILNIGYKVNMAFLPPTNSHPNSSRIAQNLPFHMIHFPMQASSAFKGEEPDTLRITDSYETIEKRVKQLRDWYPNAIYTNNHTGSVFTENDEAMDKLFRALKKYNFIFVDSRTSNKSVVKKYAQKYNMPYIVRNTFIDNDRNFNAIQQQLKKAIETAKIKGYAIAIGHPHDITLKVLKESKHLLKDVEPIFINKLPYL